MRSAFSSKIETAVAIGPNVFLLFISGICFSILFCCWLKEKVVLEYLEKWEIFGKIRILFMDFFASCWFYINKTISEFICYFYWIGNYLVIDYEDDRLDFMFPF